MATTRHAQFTSLLSKTCLWHGPMARRLVVTHELYQEIVQAAARADGPLLDIRPAQGPLVGRGASGGQSQLYSLDIASRWDYDDSDQERRCRLSMPAVYIGAIARVCTQMGKSARPVARPKTNGDPIRDLTRLRSPRSSHALLQLASPRACVYVQCISLSIFKQC